MSLSGAPPHRRRHRDLPRIHHASRHEEGMFLVQRPPLANVPHGRLHDILALAAEREPLPQETRRVLGEGAAALAAAVTLLLYGCRIIGLVPNLQVSLQEVDFTKLDVESAGEDAQLEGEPLGDRVAGGEGREDVV